MTSQNVAHLTTTPLPATVQDLMARRKVKNLRTFNDEVETIYLMLYEHPKFHSWNEASYDEEAIEGSVYIDGVKAAEMIRDKAVELGNQVVMNAKLAAIVKAVGVVQRRFDGVARNDRRSRA
jgi:hypothetical protein